MGRRTLRTDENRAIILEALEGGDTFRGACLRAGLSEDTFERWRTADADFAAALKAAQAKCRARMVATIQTAARKGVWTAAAWWLERNFPDEYALRNRMEHTGEGGGPVKVEHDFAHISNREIAEALLEADGVAEAEADSGA